MKKEKNTPINNTAKIENDEIMVVSSTGYGYEYVSEENAKNLEVQQSEKNQ